MGIKYLNLSSFIQVSTIKDEKSAAKFHYIKNCQRQSCSAFSCLSSGSNTLAGGSSVPLISERKGTDPPLESCALHTLRLIARQPRTSVTNLRSAHWLASYFHSWINSWIDCRTNVYTVWLSVQLFNQLSNQQLDQLFVQLSDPYSNHVNVLIC